MSRLQKKPPAHIRGHPTLQNMNFFLLLSRRVVDPYSFFTDPDPDPVDPDGGQYGSGYGSGSNPDPGL